MKWISSISIRIAKDYPGISNEIIRKLINGKGLPNVLIISLPGQGKTTLLRDMVRNISNGVPDAGFYGLRVSLADERGEVAAMYNGIPQFNVGDRTDVLDNVPKDQAVMMLLRSMSPQVIALDEITAPEDIKALITASYCGVRLLATAHAGETTDLKRRPLYKELLNTGIFSHAVVISVKNKKRVYNIERLTEVDTYD